MPCEEPPPDDPGNGLATRSAREPAVFVYVNVAMIGGLWVHSGGLTQLGGRVGWFSAVGRLAALYGALTLLLSLLLVARVSWMELRCGRNVLLRWHRGLGFVAASMLLAHATFTTLGFAAEADRGALAQLWVFISVWPNLLAAVVAHALMVVVVTTSLRVARRALGRQVWCFTHLFAYLAVILAFAHQLTAGSTLLSWFAVLYWAALHTFVAALLVGFGWIGSFRARRALTHQELRPRRSTVRQRLPIVGLTSIGVVFAATYDVVDPALEVAALTRAAVDSSQLVPSPPSAIGSRDSAEDAFVATGSSMQTPCGPVQVQIVVVDGELRDVLLVEQPSSRLSVTINAGALPAFAESALEAQSAAIDVVSGATVTWTAYTTSLQSALDVAGLS